MLRKSIKCWWKVMNRMLWQTAHRIGLQSLALKCIYSEDYADYIFGTEKITSNLFLSSEQLNILLVLQCLLQRLVHNNALFHISFFLCQFLSLCEETTFKRRTYSEILFRLHGLLTPITTRYFENNSKKSFPDSFQQISKFCPKCFVGLNSF